MCPPIHDTSDVALDDLGKALSQSLCRWVLIQLLHKESVTTRDVRLEWPAADNYLHQLRPLTRYGLCSTRSVYMGGGTGNTHSLITLTEKGRQALTELTTLLTGGAQ